VWFLVACVLIFTGLGIIEGGGVVWRHYHGRNLCAVLGGYW